LVFAATTGRQQRRFDLDRAGRQDENAIFLSTFWLVMTPNDNDPITYNLLLVSGSVA
jgi:hypothetical protein